MGKLWTTRQSYKISAGSNKAQSGNRAPPSQEPREITEAARPTFSQILDTIERPAMTLPRDVRKVEINHLDPHMSVCRQACIIHAAVESCSSPDPIKRYDSAWHYFWMAGEYDPAWTFRLLHAAERLLVQRALPGS